MQFTVASLALLGLASAAPTLKTSATDTSPTFNLMYQSNINNPGPIDALNTGSWYVTASNGKAVLSSFASRGLLYKYGTGPRIAQASVGLTITPGGTATVPDGKAIEFVVNNGTAPVDIQLNSSGIPTLWHDGGRFQACQGDGEEIYLSYVQPGQRFLAACAPVELQTVCSTLGVGEEMKGQLGEIEDVACIHISD
ncbi:uncharacterized protein N0V89_006889 [Didymosphaeria variabile]|uniref:Cell wall protein PhiA n=1 Tax=Didymosphaeria variabile TaxID=1932322 RepID=A0A9W8XJU1_9PLEO|nr:uncharacterized protein N0V89_006889 [Didymosphaeria variabile]KAJ4351546.1 hypothetical protein N0V89_006889 [Didymosphaeria variabile]